ncbi:hypothetical protein [Paraburkholderia lacunae]|uniref:Uncharacterized protein n=1 Tax=Paraburkholderia lacunae TaxID=2211104 RepID=A0A370N3B1_9BURK|nr:hypothetical protein [Paraburkholderia lacunae]RDK00087.1 hypothetical protein DLM46_25600 [Paraburkholderia lacunae]
MKSRVVNTLSAMSQRLPRGVPRVSQTGIALTGVVSILTLSGCYYYPYGYYPAYYPSYATVPAAATQREVPLGSVDSTAQQQALADSQASPPAYVVAQPPPVYVAPVYPAYYPPPVYPPYYGYPGWYGYGPSLSIGFGYSWGGHRHHR